MTKFAALSVLSDVFHSYQQLVLSRITLKLFELGIVCIRVLKAQILFYGNIG